MELDEDDILVNTITDAPRYIPDDRIARSEDAMFHLHGFEDHERLALFDLIALRNMDVENDARHGRGEAPFH